MQGWRIALWIGLVILVFGFLWLVRGVLLPFVLAYLVALLLEPVVKGFRRIGIGRPAAVSTITVVFFGAIVGIAIITAPYVSAQAGYLRDQVTEFTNRLQSTSPDEAMLMVDKFLSANKTTLEQLGIPANRQGLVDAYIEPNRQQFEERAQQFITGGVTSILSFVGQAFILLLTPLFAIWILMDMESLRQKSKGWIPPTIRSGTVSMVKDIASVFQGYIRGLTISVLLYTTMMTVVLWALGVPAFAVLGAMAGILYLIPVIGGLVSSGIVFIVVALSGQSEANLFLNPALPHIAFTNSWVFALVVVAGMFVAGFTYDSAINPRIVGSAVKLHPLVAVFVVFSFGALFGLPGMLLAYPVAGAINVVLARLLKVATDRPELPNLPAVPLRHRTIAET
ncbi:MAG: AI-2E family transporter [Fimbriimonadaceae bacterium]|nr:AI-2E family transporter [Fimbriimonadaceae bacterium]QYK58422.1 MAG: AI-2E family transporter [Fimbriimonadaceae bacterium]